MTGKVIDSNTTGLLILIIPIAFLIVLLLKTWPLLLAIFLLSIIVGAWQKYQWKQWSKQVNPYFNQLIKENQGCLTAVDLSVKANLSGSAARRYLEKKAEEFGAQRRVYEDKGAVYYFLTASALGSIFEESEPSSELESEPFSSQPPRLIELLAEQELAQSQEEVALPSNDSVHQELTADSPLAVQEQSKSEQISASKERSVAQKPLAKATHQDNSAAKPEKSEEVYLDKTSPKTLIQAELAKRLDVHSSTVGKRKSDPDFSQWSQSKDPEGVAWIYSADTKEFVPQLKS